MSEEGSQYFKESDIRQYASQQQSASQSQLSARSDDNAAQENQWLFSPAELENSPSIQDGMSIQAEKEQRAKGTRYIQQVGILVKVPQITLATAMIFFQRFLMRASFQKAHNSIPKLHPFQIGATALFLALKVEETPRKMKDLVQALAQVAQQNPNLVVDEQSKDYWKWRDCILENEDVLLEVLCFDLDVESSHRKLFEMLKQYKLEHNKRLRNSAWAFVTDAMATELCLIYTGRTLAAASLLAAARFGDVELPDGWILDHATLEDVQYIVTFMAKLELKKFPQKSSQNGDATGNPKS